MTSTTPTTSRPSTYRRVIGGLMLGLALGSVVVGEVGLSAMVTWGLYAVLGFLKDVEG